MLSARGRFRGDFPRRREGSEGRRSFVQCPGRTGPSWFRIWIAVTLGVTVLVGFPAVSGEAGATPAANERERATPTDPRNAVFESSTGVGAARQAPSLSIDSPSVDEGSAGSVSLTFTVTLNPAGAEQVTVDYADAGTGTATSGADYTALGSGTLTFAPGETARTVSASVTGDAVDEPDETVVVSLSGAVNATVGTASGTGTITDDDAQPTVTLALSRTSIPESGATNSAAVTASLDHASSEETTITVAAAAGTGAVASDFSLGGNAKLTIAAGATSSTGTVTVTAVDNSEDESDKSVTVSGTAVNSQGITQPSNVTLTVTDDDGAPSLSIGSASVTEGNGATANLTFTVSLDAASGKEVTVDYADAGTGTAASGADYTAVSAGTLTFAAGDTSKTITVSVTGDATDEPDETVVVSLSGAVNATIGTASGTGTITDDDAAPTVTLSVADASIPENGGTTTVSAVLSHASSAETTVTISPVSGGYTVGADAAITIAAGETANGADTVTITAVDDEVAASDRSVTVTATATNGQGIGSVTGASLTLEDDDGEGGGAVGGASGSQDSGPTVSVASTSVTEGDGGQTDLTLTVSLSAASDDPVTVDYADAGTGTAASGADYTALTAGTLTFTAGDTSETITVSVTGDTTDEPDETVVVTLSGAVNATIGTASGTGTITDDDAAPTVTLSVADASIPENGGTTTVSAVLSHASSAETTVTISPVSGGYTVGADAAITIAAGETANGADTVTITAVDDEVAGSDRSVTVTATATNGQGVGSVTGASLTLEDDDGEGGGGVGGASGSQDSGPTVSVAPASVTEGDGGQTDLTLTVSLSAASDDPVTVDYADAGTGTAASGADYTALTAGTLTFTAGDTSKTITVSVTGDATDEPDETVVVTLSGAVNATIGTASGTGTITDDDAAPTVTLSVADASIPENGGTTTVSAVLSHASSAETTVTISPVSGGYTVGADAAITIAAGETANGADTVTITAVDDEVAGSDRSVTVTATATNGQGIGSVTGASLTLEDDDGEGGGGGASGSQDDLPSLSIDSPRGQEPSTGTSEMTFTVTLSAAAEQQVTVNYRDRGTPASATSGSDYRALSPGTLTFAAGETSKTITVTILADPDDAEYAEQIHVVLSGAVNATIGTAVGVGRIADYHVPPSLSISGGSVTEGDSGAANLIFTIRLSAASSRTVRFTYSDAGTGTATSGTDYTALRSGVLTFTAGETTKTVTISVTGDTEDEPNETVVVSGSASGTSVDGRSLRATGTITNDDGPYLGIGASSVEEGDSGSANLIFTVRMTPASRDRVTVGYADAGTGTATSGTDYTPLSPGTLTFSAGETTKTITVSVLGDIAHEPDETVAVTLSGAVNAATYTATSTGTGTITNDDERPSLSIDSPRALEPETGVADLVFTVSLSAESARQITVNYRTNQLNTYTNARSGTDFQALGPGTLTFAPGQTSKKITVKVLPDTVDEVDERVRIQLSNAVNATIGNGRATGVIRDRTPDVSLVISAPSVAEGDSGSADMTFTVGLSAASERYFQVEYADAGTGTATSGTDYRTLSPGTLTFYAGESTKTITVSVTGDIADEPNETVVVRLSGGPADRWIGTATGTGTITNDDRPYLGIGSSSVEEGDSGSANLIFTVRVTPASPDRVTVDYADAGTGTATSGTDYMALSPGTLTFLAGETTKTITVSVIGDIAHEPDETVAVTLSGAVNAATYTATSTGTGTITNDDEPPSLSIDSPRAWEPETGVADLVFTVSLSAASTRQITVNYRTNQLNTYTYATSGTDFRALGLGTLTFAPAQTSKTITVKVFPDTVDEGDENVRIQLSNAVNATIGAGSATGVIRDRTPDVSLVISAPSVAEGDSGSADMTFTVGLSAASERYFQVEYADAGTGTATSGTDYTTLSPGTLTFYAGDTTKTITVSVTGDTADEPNETVVVRLSGGPADRWIGTATGTGTITNDDRPYLGIGSASVEEGDGGSANLIFTVRMTPASPDQVTVDYADAGTGTATSGTDYTALSSGTLTFPAGETTKTITVSVTGDTANEPDETVVVTLSGAVNALTYPATSTGTGTITNDDELPSLSISGGTVSEGDTGSANLVFTVSLDAASGREVTVNYADAGTGTGASGTDYAALPPGTLTFGAGDTSKQVTVRVRGDSLEEEDETVVVEISSAVNATIGTSTGTGTITNDDVKTVRLVVSPSSIAESGARNSATVAAQLSESSTAETTVVVSVAAGAGAVSSDFTVSGNRTLTILAGHAGGTRALTITAVDNTTDEPDKTITVSGTATNSEGIAGPSDVTLTITDDDAEPSLSIGSATVAEGNTGSANLTYTVTLSAASGKQVTVDYEDAGTGTATSGTDYTALTSGTLTFTAGDTSETITVPVRGDTTDEPDETVVVTLSGAVNATIGTASETGTITDDDATPKVTLALSRAAVAESGTTNSTSVTASLNHASSERTTITVSAAPGTAASATDYRLSPQRTLTIAAGATSSSGTVTITAVDNTADEPNKSVTVSGSASNSQGATNPSSVTLTITDDDAAPTVALALSRSTITESGAANSATVTATLDRRSSEPTTITVGAAASGAHTVAGDFSLSSNAKLTIAAGATSSTGTVTITAVDNTEDEADKSVTVSGTAANTQGITQPSTVTLAITDDDDAPSLSVGSASVSEGDSGSANLVFTVMLDAASGKEVTVDYAEGTGGTATSGTDYTAPGSGTLTFTAGDTSEMITVSVRGDTTDEPDETVVITLSGAVNATIGTASGTGTITDDDATPTVTLTLSRTSIAESGATNSTTVTASLNRASSQQTTITVGAAAGTGAVAGDFTLSSNAKLTIAAGTTSSTGTVTITAVDNNEDEADKSVTASGTAANTQGITQPSAVTLTITDDDDPPSLSIGSATVAEGNSGSVNLTYTVTLDAASGKEVTVGYAEGTGGTATSGTDYAAITAGTLTFTAGDTSETITVSVRGDRADEPDERVVVSLSGAVNATIGTADGTGTITDDDDAPTVTLSLSPGSIAESGSTNRSAVTASLDHPSSQQTTITVAATAGTGAVSGDFTLSSNTKLTIAALATSSTGTVTITAVNNSEDEADKSVTVSGTAANTQGITQPSAVTLTITDDDDPPSLSIGSATVAEGNSGSVNLTYTVTLDAASGKEVTVGYADAGTGTATSGTDYAALTAGTLTFTAGDTSETITVSVTGDTTTSRTRRWWSR